MSILKYFIPFIAIICLYLLFIKVILPGWYKIKIARFEKKKIIEITNKESFLIHTPKKGTQQYNWKDISKIDLLQNNFFKVYFNNNSELLLKDKDFSDLIPFVRAIPEGKLVNESLKAYKTDYFANLVCCKVCGKISVKNNCCLSCLTDTYEFYLKEVKNNPMVEKEYIKTHQLEWFTSFIKFANVNFYYEDALYKNCQDWAPLVTAREVIKYNENESGE